MLVLKSESVSSIIRAEIGGSFGLGCGHCSLVGALGVVLAGLLLV